MGRGQALAAVRTGDADAGEAGVEELALDGALVGDLGQLLLVGLVVAQQRAPGALHRRLEVGPHELTGPAPEGIEVLDLVEWLTPPPPDLLHDGRDPPAVLAGCPVERAVERLAPQIEVQVVLVGHADAAVELDALLEQLVATVADVGRRRADHRGGVLGAVGDGVRAAASLMAWLASSQVFMSAKRCLSAW